MTPTITPEALDYTPGELDRTAPERIWLQIDTADDNDDRGEQWPGSEHVTWQEESIGGLEVQYVRADLAALPELQAAQPSIIEQIAQQWDGCNFDPMGETIDIGDAIRRAGKRLQTEALSQPQAEQQGAGDAPIDVTDPWRGLYRAESLRANGDGDLYHPDMPSWPDDREDALDKLLHAQGFDFQIVPGEFTEEAMEDGDELYWQEMRAWNPEAPEGDWRLAWKGDTEDGPSAWFVRPMALRPDPEALAARQPVGQEPVAQVAQDFVFMLRKQANGERWPIGTKLYAAPPAPAAVSVAPRRCEQHCQNGRSDICLASQRDNVICPDDICDIDVGIRENHLRATHPRPAAPAAAVPEDVRRDAERFRILMSNYVQRWKDSNTGAPSSANFCFECKGWDIDKALDDEVRAMAAQPQGEGVGRG